jgi:hypothetical protein
MLVAPCLLHLAWVLSLNNVKNLVITIARNAFDHVAGGIKNALMRYQLNECRSYINSEVVVLADHRVSYTLVGLDLNLVIFSRKYNQTNTQLLNFYNNDLSVIQQQALLKQMNVSIILVDKTKHSVELVESIKTYAKKEAEQGLLLLTKLIHQSKYKGSLNNYAMFISGCVNMGHTR